MTKEEFSNEFDILVDSYKRFKAYDSQAIYDSIEFNEYEKSVFLTKAQEDIILDIYKGGYTSTDSFEQTEETRRYLQSLVTTHSFPEKSTTTKENNIYVLDYELPSDVWFIVSESFVYNSNSKLVTPVKQDELYKILNNPFKTANKNRVLRADKENKLLIYSSENRGIYEITYLKKVSPIILTTLPEGITIDGKSSISNIEVDSSLHKRILERAVTLGLQSKVTKEQ